jgi:hypothetical protein
MVDKTKAQYKEFITFTKQLLRLIVTAAFLGAGTYDICLGQRIHTSLIKAALILFAGAIVGLYGFIELYKTLTRKIA